MPFPKVQVRNKCHTVTGVKTHFLSIQARQTLHLRTLTRKKEKSKEEMERQYGGNLIEKERMMVSLFQPHINLRGLFNFIAIQVEVLVLFNP